MLPLKEGNFEQQDPTTGKKRRGDLERKRTAEPIKSSRQSTTPTKSIRRRRSTAKRFLGIGSRVWTVITALSTIGGLTAYFVFWPRLDISEGPHTKDENPLGIPFAVSNNGVLPVYPQELFCWIYNLETDKRQRVQTWGFMQRAAGVLRAGETVHFVPKFTPLQFSGRITSADLLIIARYRTVWQQTKAKRERFFVNRDAEGQLRYLRKYLTPEDRAFRPEGHAYAVVPAVD